MMKTSLRERSAVRKRLRGPANLQFAIADRIGMLNAEAWQALTAQSGFFLSHSYLAAMEAVLPGNLSPRYALVYANVDGQPQAIAAVYMQIAEISLAQARPGKSVGTTVEDVSALDRLAINLKQRILTCGNLLTYGQHGVALAPGIDQELAWHAVAEVLYRVRQAEKLAGSASFVMIKDLHPPYTGDALHLAHLSYRYVETEPNMVLTLGKDWTSYEDYLASLASKYRTGIRNAVFKPMAAAQCTVERLDDIAGMHTQLHALYKAVQMNAGFRPFELPPNYFPMLQAAAGDRFRCSAVKREGKLLGFLISIADGETAMAYHIGFDREAAADLPIYLRLLHAGIADAIELGCQQVSFGRTALEPKAALGAKPVAFGVLLRHRQPVMNKLIKHLLLGIEHDDAPERSPFKKTA